MTAKNSHASITGANGHWIREAFFYLGLIGAIGLRIVLILNNVNPVYAKAVWYVAMVSLTGFYYYRKWIEQKRRRIILDNDLINKVNKNNLKAGDRDKIAMLLGSTIVSKQMLNLNILFFASVIALVIQLAIDIRF